MTKALIQKTHYSDPPKVEDYLSGESLTVEYKRDDGSFSDQKIIDPIVAMANAQGGALLLGVKDNAEVIGSKRLKEGYWKNTQAIEGLIQANTSPSLVTRVYCLSYQNKKVILIKVPKAETTVGTSKGKFLKRRINAKGKPENVPMTPDEIVNGYSRVGYTDFSAKSFQDLNFDSLDSGLIQETQKALARTTNHESDQERARQSPQAFVQGLGLLDHRGSPKVAGLLLFGKPEILSERLPNSSISYQVFDSQDSLLKNLKWTAPIVKVFKEILAEPELNHNSDEFIYRDQSVVIPEYSRKALREAIANAMVHRNYTLASGILIQKYTKELLITSPGSFPEGVRLDNLLSVPPTPRNPCLAEAMLSLKLVEKSGRGIDFIYRDQARYGRPAPDYSASDEYRVSVRLVGGKANLDFCKFIASLHHELNATEMLLINALFFRQKLSLERASQLIQRPELQSEEVLYSLHQKGIVSIHHQAGLPVYFLKASLSPKIGKKIFPKRIKKVEIDKYCQNILEILNREGPLTSSELGDAVGLSQSQTYRLLIKLTKKELAERKEKKWHSKTVAPPKLKGRWESKSPSQVVNFPRQ